MTEPLHHDAEDLLLVPTGKPIDLYPVLLAILRQKLLILGCGLLCGLAAWLYLLHVPSSYRATVEILPPQIGRGVGFAAMLNQSGSDASALSMLGGSIQAKTQGDSFIVILAAWPIQDALVRQFDLVKVYHTANNTQARAILTRSTEFKSTKDGFITISIFDTDRSRSAAMANAYVDQAREFLRGLAITEASQRRAFYERQLTRVKEDLAQAELAFQQVQQTSGMVSLDSQAKALLESAAGLRGQITAKEVQIQSLRSYSTANNPQVQIAESELTALQKQLSQLESSGQGGYSGKALSSVPGSELAFLRATRELKYQESLYDLLVKQYEGSRIDEARDAPGIQVIEPALVPDRPFGPRRFRDIRLAFLAGLGVGLVLALLLHWRASFAPETRSRLAELRRAALRF